MQQRAAIHVCSGHQHILVSRWAQMVFGANRRQKNTSLFEGSKDSNNQAPGTAHTAALT